tara:strand:- start:488 stop:748 length:261 start_codon:yes stop_codon:yes gene_type:complete
MKNKKLKERLDLLAETRVKISKMKISSAFATDFGVLRLLERLSEDYQDLISENLNLEKHLKIQSVTRKLEDISPGSKSDQCKKEKV